MPFLMEADGRKFETVGTKWSTLGGRGCSPRGGGVGDIYKGANTPKQKCERYVNCKNSKLTTLNRAMVHRSNRG